ncbi:hypothetical protein BpHYR1_025990 [Brachionus plicatilis]|uniref:Uncharacterized protein n=1 Tax=Brachionus plicatilis TaxID=10195 RepID=A0A3M7Q3W2_BRAPC|nr:hypothetical protein BpHYR1_025990 [Brachionus plicatilis]
MRSVQSCISPSIHCFSSVLVLVAFDGKKKFTVANFANAFLSNLGLTTILGKVSLEIDLFELTQFFQFWTYVEASHIKSLNILILKNNRAKFLRKFGNLNLKYSVKMINLLL